MRMQLAFTSADELARLLHEAGEPLDYREVWPRVFPPGDYPPELMRALVDDLVCNDERFVWESSVHVALGAWRAQHRDLADVTFTVVDLETTGSTPGFAKITEIGAVRVVGGQVTSEFSQLVDPQRPIPPAIVALTGITPRMVRGKPTVRQALPRFVDFSRDSVLVAHNARFDMGFLDYELGVLQRCSFPRPVLDTMRLARRLWPQERSSLAALSERFALAAKPSHRALDDARATAELLLVFVARLQEDGIHTLEDLVRFCAPESRRNYHKIVLTEKLPKGPGVYIMRDARGAPLYVGKAESLRRRTRDHFLQKQAHGARQALELLDHIDVRQTGSEFEALLLEMRLITELQPPYNERGTHASSYQYVKLSAERYPRLYATPNHLDDGAVYAGPFRSQSFARRLVECLTAVYPLRTCPRLPKPVPAQHQDGTRVLRSCARYDMGACLAPCRSELDGTYEHVVAQVRRVLDGDGDGLQALLDERMAKLVATRAFEQAAKLQAQRDTVCQALRLLQRLRSAQRTHAVLVYPSREPGQLRLWSVAHGCVVADDSLAAAALTHEEAVSLVRRLYAAQPPRPPLPAHALDETLLLEGWLRRHREAPNVVLLPEPPQTTTALDTVVEHAARALTRSALLCSTS